MYVTGYTPDSIVHHDGRIDSGDELIHDRYGRLTFNGVSDDGQHTIVTLYDEYGDEQTFFFKTVEAALCDGRLRPT